MPVPSFHWCQYSATSIVTSGRIATSAPASRCGRASSSGITATPQPITAARAPASLDGTKRSFSRGSRTPIARATHCACMSSLRLNTMKGRRAKLASLRPAGIACAMKAGLATAM